MSLDQFVEHLDLAVWWPLAMSALRILVILLAGWILVGVLQRGVSAFRARAASRMTDTNALQRAETLGRAARYVIAVVVGVIALMLVLSELDISLAPILGASGVIGLAIGFGSQSLVKDYFSGLFILLEDQIRKGDVVKVASLSGLVEDVTLRHVRLRDYDGNVHFIPNNLITTVTNLSRNFAYAVTDVPVAYRENVDEVIDVLRVVGAEMRDAENFASRILEPLEVAGVERWDDSAVVIRCRFKTIPLEQWNVRRELLRRLKAAFDARGIEIPYPHLTVYPGAGVAALWAGEREHEGEGARH
ncbi:MAG: mechanosensitive ion channel family protein [Gammaproteobacteria bacterium]